MGDELFGNVIAAALERIRANVERGTPYMAHRLLKWMNSLYPHHSLQEYCTHPESFPLLLAPWWLEEALRQKPDISFQLDLIHSSLNMYYHIRLIDNLMDRDVPTDLALLPALGFFHTELQSPYHRYFAHRSYRTSRVFQFFMACLGCSALQKGPLWWAAHHRQHHR